MTQRLARLDHVVGAVLDRRYDGFDMILAVPPMECEIDPVGVTALLHALVSCRMATEINELILGVRTTAGSVEFALWDDGRPAPFHKVVSALASHTGASIRASSTDDGGIGVTVTLPRHVGTRTAA